ncbi:Mitochondrial import inner membrane translocase subunit tim22 [Coemansia spiralis]|uniref:Mitochondrial import inner membrane translocase subunit TIM22 n=2 Tax=Coemansia TaxID=4863 RepID=A0A9W8GAZ7_9FUNG|nr:mitochondrial inner membrane translocase subunit Tim17/Tim22/Tim23/peroxisomal protein PMP24 [Coemansia spiralis]KAJ1994963.1 Mitochondrial import inner membrane translocase subunit tim22 [Coemansia umbellata]KAJ2624599.1 Mitochondrial import inner membrane translocase subunit tim22 [Coemansia sp. RSA 1358]KAJ2679813.1 Mitochondrial import inner membrane translocase subunit tim22 [Coemansia spiralis]
MSNANPFTRTPTQNERNAAAQVMDSCVLKTGLSGVAGYGMGAVFGLVLSGIEFSSPVDTNAPTKQQVKTVLSDMKTKSLSSAKNFAIMAAIYSGSECLIESYRARKDIYTSIGAGCMTGGGMAIRTGPRGMAAGCAGFAAFSAAVDWYLHKDD